MLEEDGHQTFRLLEPRLYPDTSVCFLKVFDSVKANGNESINK